MEPLIKYIDFKQIKAYELSELSSLDNSGKYNNRYRSGTTSLNNETSSQSRAYPLKRKLDDTDFDQMADFVLGVFRKIKEKKTGKTENRSFHWRKTKP
ncbi:uncharacterized protein OCT59_029233 [Rhizophagus irregularis]|uniref:uncharacterized protein n=1 Tax=Rhizophagus irregularis TaxID=588596 RepID=UPI00332CE6AC|nr:hypothetical protein OCT59_029233 [Rhizophagus irregularis]